MPTDHVARVDLFLTIAIPLLPVMWIVLALETATIRRTFESATLRWIRHGGLRRSKGNLRATFWASTIAMCFAYGGFAEALSLAAILFGWQATEELAAELLLVAVLLALILVVWVLLLQVGGRVDTETVNDEKRRPPNPGEAKD